MIDIFRKVLSWFRSDEIIFDDSPEAIAYHDSAVNYYAKYQELSINRARGLIDRRQYEQQIKDLRQQHDQHQKARESKIKAHAKLVKKKLISFWATAPVPGYDYQCRPKWDVGECMCERGCGSEED